MIVLHPGDQVHITFWYNPTMESIDDVYKKLKPIFEGNGVNIYSHTGLTGSPFPMQVIAFRRPEREYVQP